MELAWQMTTSESGTKAKNSSDAKLNGFDVAMHVS
jgi:hypothetical protein